MTKISQNIETCLVFLLSWGAFEGHYIAHGLHADTFEDLLRARSCAEHNLCELSGAATTVPGIEQGALFTHFLAFLRGEGASIDQIWSLTFVFLALAVTLLFVVLKRYMERGSALLGSVVALFVFLFSDILRVLWNPSLQPLPTVLFFGCSLLVIEKVTFWRVALLGLAMGLLVEVHPIGLIAAPASFWFVAARHASWWKGGLYCLAGAGIGVAVFFGISPRAATYLSQWLVTHLGGTGFVLLVGGGLGSAWCLRRKVMEMERNTAAICFCYLTCMTALLVNFGALLSRGGGDFVVPRYFIPALPGAVFLVGYVWDKVTDLPPFLMRGALLFLGLGVYAHVFAPSTVSESFVGPLSSLQGAASLRSHFEREDLSLDDAWARMRGLGGHRVLPALSAMGLNPASSGKVPSKKGLYVFEVGNHFQLPGSVRGDWVVVESSPRNLLVGEMTSFLDHQRFRVCVGGEGAKEPLCNDVDLGKGVLANMVPKYRKRLSSWDHLRLDLGMPSPDAFNAEFIEYRFPVSIPGGSPARRLVLNHGEACLQPEFSGVEGLKHELITPEEIKWVSTESSQRGFVRVKASLARCTPFEREHLFIPCLTEISDDDPQPLRRLLEL